MAEMKGISSLTHASIEKAFEKTNEECRRPDTELVRLRENQYEDALSIIKNWDEPLGKSLNIQWSKERESSWRRTFDEGLSLMLLDSNNGEAIGIRIIKQDVKNEKFDPSKIKDDAVRKIHTFIHQEVEESRFYEKYCAEESFHFLGLAVSEKYQKKGYGKYLLEVGVEFVKNLGICPYIHGEGSSAYSQKIYEKMGFETLKEVAFEDYKVNGEIVFKNTGAHKTFKVYGLRCI